ncbi:MAG TPA: Cof-type HAD-IIB family hydrolase [Candidatus Anaerostipes avistercoris]|uniref:Cof-type HAD-IIB family hydrolase n=1 Tax=Candidatus Anaerostipes avistercoris TaxID=2838462 RepID=A0A9D2TA94_9FIRM|nr:Cof-type HAD-IIB family hydrolase [uncultured Anaerostipes sp.]HJC51419.1 Cof-type HAD-IIB family hydrolase [Candidatus Anaerostipes avistercoris]
MSKIVFFDIDGTLFYSGIGIPHSAKEALKQLFANGHKAVMCTGRSRGMIPESYFHMGFHGMILGAGAYVEYEGKVLRDDLMSGQEVRKVIDWGRKQEIGIILEGKNDGYYDADNHQTYYTDMVRRTERDCEVKLKSLSEAEAVQKWTYHHLDPERKYEIEDILKGKYIGTFHEPANSVEFLPKGIQKAKGIEWILEHTGLSWEDTYAFGDSANDIDMIRYVHYGTAMGNAVPELKEAADYVTERADRDGIALGLEHFGLI